MRNYQNVMELLVDQEVKRQLNQLPVKLTQYINLSEVATYALNRLPPLYASNVKSWRHQKLRGEKKLQNHITTAVTQAFVAIQRDLIQRSTPHRCVSPSRQPSPVKVTQQVDTQLSEPNDYWNDALYQR